MKSLKNLVSESSVVVKFSDILKARTEDDYKKIYGQLVDYFKKNAKYIKGLEEFPPYSKRSGKVYVIFTELGTIQYGTHSDEYEIKWNKRETVVYSKSWWNYSFDKSTRVYKVPKELMSDLTYVTEWSELDPIIAKHHYALLDL